MTAAALARGGSSAVQPAAAVDALAAIVVSVEVAGLVGSAPLRVAVPLAVIQVVVARVAPPPAAAVSRSSGVVAGVTGRRRRCRAARRAAPAPPTLRAYQVSAAAIRHRARTARTAAGPRRRTCSARGRGSRWPARPPRRPAEAAARITPSHCRELRARTMARPSEDQRHDHGHRAEPLLQQLVRDELVVGRGAGARPC